MNPPAPVTTILIESTPCLRSVRERLQCRSPFTRARSRLSFRVLEPVPAAQLSLVLLEDELVLAERVPDVHHPGALLDLEERATVDEVIVIHGHEHHVGLGKGSFEAGVRI